MRVHGRARGQGAAVTALALAGLLVLASCRADPPISHNRAAPSPATGLEASAPGLAAPGPTDYLGAAPPPGALAPTPDALTALLRSQAPARDPVDLARRRGRLTGPLPSPWPAPAATRQVGERDTFWVHDINRGRYFQAPATLRIVTDEAYFWVQEGQEAADRDLSRAAAAFGREVLGPVRQVFGPDWQPGQPGDPRLHVLHHQPISGVAGYFSSTDAFPIEVEPYSNEREMFYINNGVYSPGDFEYLSLLAHELQHMIHFSQDPGESVWVNEGLSELATVIAGYQHQFGDAFLAEPDTPLTEWRPGPASNAPHYAAAFLFFAWLRAQYGEAAISAIVRSPEPGPAGIEAGLAEVGAAQSFDSLFLDWSVANLVDNNRHAGGRFGYGDGSISRVVPRTLAAEGVEDTVGQYATDYFDVTSLVADGRLELAFAADSQVGLLEPGPTAPGKLWWSGRGDNRDSRLTRRFDLGPGEASLRFRMWHELEEGWDYAYLLASTDEGQTWIPLGLPGASDDNPSGNNFGLGLTGTSGGWQDVTVDLTPFSGRPLWLSFEVITDDAVNLSGLALDDLRLDGAGLGDDAEDDAGWQAQGWVRLDPNLPQRWGLSALVEHRDGIEVQRQLVTEDGRANVVVTDIPPDGRVTVTVSGLTPGTRQRAGYRLAPEGS